MAVTLAAPGAELRVQSQSDFRVFTTSNDGLTFYFIESTAPDNVEERVDPGGASPPVLVPIDPDKAVTAIAETLVPAGEPDVDANLVVMVHGFNNPRPSVLTFYNAALEALLADRAAIFSGNRRIVCIGYRWPSERTFSVVGSSLSALPLFPLSLLAASFLVLAIILWAALKFVGWGPAELSPLFWSLVTTSVALISTIAVIALLRAIVYFRDVYRATNYGVPDLVEVIRQIDVEAAKRADGLRKQEGRTRKRIALSFVAHSMGGLVVTNAIRVLSDVFDKSVIRTSLSGIERPEFLRETPDGQDIVTGKIGHVFTLMRFVLASPDIPAETLLADRANFLASSLRRFREAYLFSSEGDEVLRLISTTVNYFSFPTASRNYGYRLGNVEILSSGFGEISNQHVLTTLRVGAETLAQLSAETTRGRLGPDEVAEAFTYFDCTDYVDGLDRRGMLTEARNYKARNPAAHIPYAEHIKLLIRYVIPGEYSINVHGGYFDGAVTRRLIFRLGCLGFEDAAKAYGGRALMVDECAHHQIRVMPSKRLQQKYHRPSEPMHIMAGCPASGDPDPPKAAGV